PPPLHHPPTPHIHTLSLHDALPIFGYGLEGALTDATTKRIIDEEITPKFKSGDFAGGISAGVNRMLRVVDGEKLPAPEPEHWQSPGLLNYVNPLNPFVIVGVFIVGGILRT